MAILKCKMCGGDLNLIEGASTAACEYCGSMQTVPKVDDEKKLIQFERAERLRKQCEFDKAAGIYESIVANFRQEAEAYWGLVLCKYGIEYVDDPATGKKIPTCHRSGYDSVFDDNNFELALENADVTAQKAYRAEAKQFEQIRKSILEVSSTEKPYDIFICYKETDEIGNRTLDSVLAQDLYGALTGKGYRVFFSRITLQEKLGEAYEPYIFAALNSAKVLLAVGTCYEYYTAVWVKNEWSRYLKICQGDKTKHLIPCYKDLDPEDMPREFRHLQGADLGKMGAIQDVLFNIEKYIPLHKATTETNERTTSTIGDQIAPLLKRVFMFLEDGEWGRANEFCEQILNIDPECAQAYLGKLMADLRVRKQEQLNVCAEPFDKNNNYQKALRFADDSLKETLTGHINHINNRIATEEKDTILSQGNTKMSGASVSDYEAAIGLFRSISGWKDADEKICICQKRIEEFKEKAERQRLEDAQKAKNIAKRNKKIAAIAIPTVCTLIAFAIIIFAVIIPNGKYNDAIALMNEGKPMEAYDIFYQLGNHKNSKELAQKCAYLAGEQVVENDKVSAALMFGKAGDYQDAHEKSIALWNQIAKRRLVDVGCYYVVAVSDEGKVILNGDNVIGGYTSKLMTWNNLIAIAGGDWVTAGLRKDGTVVAAGDGVDGVKTWKNIVSIEAGNDAIAGLRTDGTVVCTNAELNKAVSKWSNIVAIDMENSYIMGLQLDGTVVCTIQYWDMSCFTDIVQIAAGSQHCAGLRSDGTVVAVGDEVSGTNARTEVEMWTDIVSISAASFITYGVKSDGTVLSTGNKTAIWGQDYGLDLAEMWTNVETISSSYINVACIHKDGTVSSITHAGQADLNHANWKLYKKP